MKKIVLTLVLGIIFAWQGLGLAATTAVDSLIQKLEDKGILTDQEATQIKGEIAQDQQASQQATVKSMLPDWIQNIKLTGDMRIRYQYQRRADKSVAKDTIYDRGRVRARLNFEDQVNDKVKVIFGIATDGAGNKLSTGNFARSNNLSFGGNTGDSTADAFGKDSIVVNKAYAQYKPWDTVTIQAGKMDNPIWEPQTSFLWDPNITPEGGSIQIEKKINDMLTPWATAEFDVLSKNTPSTQNPWMTAVQAGAKGNLTDKVYYKAAGVYYNIQDPTQGTLNIDQRSQDLTNTTNAAGTSYLYTFDSIYGGTAEIGMNDPLGEVLDVLNVGVFHPYLPQVGVFGSYIKNPGANKDGADDAAWQIGGYMGNSALNGWGTWKFISAYKVIERDAWMDVFPDYDFYTGDTDVAGWRNELDIGLMKNVYLGLNVYSTRIYKPYVTPAAVNAFGTGIGGVNSTNAPSREILTQADINFKF